MSLSKSVARRLSLLAGSSLAAASLSFGVAAVVPTVALAANECAPVNVAPTANDPGLLTRNPDTYACSGASTYATSGITYSSQGNLTVNSIGAMNVGPVGINLAGNAADSVTFTATGTITGTADAAIDVTSATGPINIATAGILSFATGTTHGVRALSSGGSIAVTTGSITSGTAVTGQSGIEARVTGGNGPVSITTTGAVSGRLRGIHAQSSGSGALTITTGGAVSVSSTTTNGGVGQIAAIDAVSGTGPMWLNLNGNVTGTAASAIRAVAGGAIDIDIAATRVISAGLGSSSNATPVHWVMDLDAAGAVTIDNAGTIRSTAAGGFTSGRGYDDLGIRVSGTTLTLNNDGGVYGRVDFSDVSGGVVFNNTGLNSVTSGWFASGDSIFSPGNDTINIGAGGFITLGMYQDLESGARESVWASIDFLGGANVINNAGTLNIGGFGVNDAAVVVTMTGLSTFNNSGLITLGSRYNQSNQYNIGDGIPDDVLVMAGADFIGSGASRIIADVDFSGLQANCAEAEARIVAGLPATADCLSLPGGTTGGSTLLTLRDATPGNVFGGFLGETGIVLVDVADGTSDASHFTLDPNSDNYVAVGARAGMLKKGYFVYALAYDPDRQQHLLLNAPDTELMEFTVLPQMVQGIWQTSTSTWFDHRGGARGDDAEAGVWLRATGENVSRDLVQNFTNGPLSVSSDNSYTQKTVSLTGGVDLARGGNENGAYAFGAMLGYVDSRLNFETSDTAGKLKGGTMGLYGSYSISGFFLDAAVNGVVASLDLDAPLVSLPSGLVTTKKVRGVGGQAELGWTGDFGAFRVEPFIAASYMRARFDQVVLNEAKIDYEDPTTLRVGVGARFTADLETVRVALTGRYWNEMEGENEMLVDNDAVDLPVADDFSGGFAEFNGYGVIDIGAGLAAFVGAGVKLADGYNATSGSVGLSYRW